MAKTNKMEKTATFSETCASIISGVIGFFILILVLVFPLIYDNSYFNILETKYKCYYMSILGMLGVVLVLALVMMMIDKMEHKGVHTKALLEKLLPRNWKTTFRLPDVAVLVFLLVAVISTLQSDYVFESFWGNEGRYTGLFLLLLYVIAYFLISRFWKVKSWYIEVFLISGVIMCIIGITDYFQLDVLDFRGKIKPEQSAMFTSTVGNINTYTAYVGLVMGFATAMFTTSKKTLPTVWYGICMVISFFAIIMGCSDNAYLAIGALFAFLPLFLFKNKEGIRRYLIVLALFVTVIQGIDLINQSFSHMVIELDSMFRVLVNFDGLLLAMFLLWGAVAILYSKKHRLPQAQEELGNRYVRIWLGFLLFMTLILCFVLYDANASGSSGQYGALGRYFVFDDSWGTNRGYIWRKSIELYREFPLMHKLFGYGPDTFGILTINEIKFEMINATNQVFDSAHNEYLQYLVTIGPIGLVAYVTFLISSGIYMMKQKMQNPYIVGCCVAVLCYGIQALVNLNLPIATPIMWLLLSIGMAAGRKREA